MKKILIIGLMLAALLITTAMPVAAADTATATIVKAWVIGPGGKLLTIGSQGSGEITVAPGDALIIMGMAKKDGKESLSFNLSNVSADPSQVVVTKLFQAKAKNRHRSSSISLPRTQKEPLLSGLMSAMRAEQSWTLPRSISRLSIPDHEPFFRYLVFISEDLHLERFTTPVTTQILIEPCNLLLDIHFSYNPVAF